MRAYKYYSEIQEGGKLEISSLPIKKGQMVEVIVLPMETDTADFLSAAESSLDFWDNEIDDRIWKVARCLMTA